MNYNALKISAALEYILGFSRVFIQLVGIIEVHMSTVTNTQKCIMFITDLFGHDFLRRENAKSYFNT